MADIVNNVITRFKSIFANPGDTQKAVKRLRTLSDVSGRGTLGFKTLKSAALSLNVPMKIMEQQFSRAGLSVLKNGQVMQNATGRILDMKQALNEVNRANRRFEMGFLSLMFASMALNRAVGGFLRNAITAYGKAAGESNAFLKSTNSLIAAWEFFKFSIIDALTKSEAFASFVKWTTDLVNKFNELSPVVKSVIASFLGFLFIVSLLGMIIGQVGLAGGGIKTLGDMWVVAMSVMTAAATALGISVIALFALIAIAIIVAIALWQTDFGKFKDFIKNTFTIIWITIKNVFKDLVKLVKTVFGFIKAIFKGDFEEAGNMFEDFKKLAIRIFLKMMVGISAIIVNVFAFAWNMAVDSMQLSINSMIFMINKLIDKLNELPFIDIGKIGSIDFSGVHAAYLTSANILDKFDKLDVALATSEELAPAQTALPMSSMNNTTVDTVNFNFSDAATDKEDMKNAFMDLINGEVNEGLDSSNT